MRIPGPQGGHVLPRSLLALASVVAELAAWVEKGLLPQKGLPRPQARRADRRRFSWAPSFPLSRPIPPYSPQGGHVLLRNLFDSPSVVAELAALVGKGLLLQKGLLHPPHLSPRLPGHLTVAAVRQAPRGRQVREEARSREAADQNRGRRVCRNEAGRRQDRHRREGRRPAS